MALLPIAMLMTEHAAIARAGALVDQALAKLERGEPLSPEFLQDAADFAETYIGGCHHAKEEQILFQELQHKRLPCEVAALSETLTQEHAVTGQIVQAIREYGPVALAGDEDALEVVRRALRGISQVYPRHIEREEKLLFVPVMRLFSDAEIRLMTRRFRELDAELIHRRYLGRLTFWEKLPL